MLLQIQMWICRSSSRLAVASQRLHQRQRPVLLRQFSSTLPSGQQIHDADESTFKSHISKTKDKIILVDFYEDWCPPCKVLSPLLQRIEGDPSLIGAQHLDLITIRGESVPELAAQFKIRAVPTVFAFKNGSVLGQFTGAQGLPQIKQWFASLQTLNDR